MPPLTFWYFVVNSERLAGCDGHGPCIHGTCEQSPNGTYFCNCDEGWYGPRCDVPGRAFCLVMPVCHFMLSDTLDYETPMKLVLLLLASCMNQL